MTDYQHHEVDENEVPRDFNAASDYVDRHLAEGRGDHPAFIDVNGSHSYAELAVAVNRVASSLVRSGIHQEDRVAMIMLDTVDFPVTFLGAIRAGIVPVPLNTLLTSEQYAYVLADCRARVLFVSEALFPVVKDMVTVGRDRVVAVLTPGADGTRIEHGRIPRPIVVDVVEIVAVHTIHAGITVDIGELMIVDLSGLASVAFQTRFLLR